MANFGLTTNETPLNPDCNDLALDEFGNLVFWEGEETLANEVAQSIRNRLLMYRGEWFYDLDEGIPYFEEVLRKAPDFSLIDQIFRQAISETPGVQTVTRLRFRLDRVSRCLNIFFDALLDNGESLNESNFGRFVVNF